MMTLVVVTWGVRGRPGRGLDRSLAELVLDMAVPGMVVLGMVVLGTAVLGTAVLGMAVPGQLQTSNLSKVYLLLLHSRVIC